MRLHLPRSGLKLATLVIDFVALTLQNISDVGAVLQAQGTHRVCLLDGAECTGRLMPSKLDTAVLTGACRPENKCGPDFLWRSESCVAG